jgi:hypothetical protein
VGRNKKSNWNTSFKVEGRKITNQQTIAETFSDYFVAIAENVKRQSKNNLINDNDYNIDNQTHFMEQELVNATQQWNINARQWKK